MTAEAITSIASCVVAATGIAGATLAALGLKTWRAQLEGSARFDLARRLLVEVYQLRDALEYVRHPLMFVGEAAGGDPQTDWDIVAYERRWQRVTDVQGRLAVCVYECEVLWSEPITELARELRGHISDLSLAVSAFVREKQKGGAGLSDKQTAILYGGMDDDTYRKELQSIVERIEIYVRPHLPRPRSAKTQAL
jgi:hypothetical protein